MRGVLVGGPYDGTELDIDERELGTVITRLMPESKPTDLYASERLTFRGKSRVGRDGRVRLVHGGPLPEDDGMVTFQVDPDA
jgi:hypothetical protein